MADKGNMFSMESGGVDTTTRLDKANRGYTKKEKTQTSEDLDDFDFSAPTKKEQTKKKASEILASHQFHGLKKETNCAWRKLPDSINGTLIYFLLVEHNAKNFPVFEIVCWMFSLGLPVYLSFYIQSLFIYWIYQVSPDYDESPLCSQDSYLQHAVICIFFIFMYPSITSIVTETYILLRSTRVVLMHEEEDDRILLYELFSPMSKRLFLFFMIPFIESCILGSLYYVGSKFIITSDDVSDLIINSVAIAFIMDVDNLAREFFQTEEVSEHVDQMLFESKMQQMEAKLTSVDDVHAKDQTEDDFEDKLVDPEIVATFWNLEKVVMVIAIAGVYTVSLRWVFCDGSTTIDPDTTASMVQNGA